MTEYLKNQSDSIICDSLQSFYSPSFEMTPDYSSMISVMSPTDRSSEPLIVFRNFWNFKTDDNRFFNLKNSEENKGK